jgi:hypothetical protein
MQIAVREPTGFSYLFSFAEYPVASGLRSRSGYFGGVGCCGELYLVCLDCLVEPAEPDKQNKPDRPDEPD